MRVFTGDMNEWADALAPHGVTELQLPGVVEALRDVGIEAYEVSSLIREYGRAGPNAPRPFPGFGMGDEQEIARELDAVREALRDPLKREIEKNRMWYEA